MFRPSNERIALLPALPVRPLVSSCQADLQVQLRSHVNCHVPLQLTFPNFRNELLDAECLDLWNARQRLSSKAESPLAVDVRVDRNRTDVIY